MNVLFNLIVVVQVVSALAIIGLVLVQHGKGADMGAAFGSGSAGSLFGASGSANFLSRTTAIPDIQPTSISTSNDRLRMLSGCYKPFISLALATLGLPIRTFCEKTR